LSHNLDLPCDAVVRRCATLRDAARRCTTLRDAARRCATLHDAARRCATLCCVSKKLVASTMQLEVS
jgi:hypothetical protein